MIAEPPTPFADGEARTRLEATALRSARAGDAGAFETLLRLHQDFVFRFCLSMLRNESDAEDATQEVFVRAWRNLRRFRGEAGFRTWLGSIAVNHCRDRLRRRRRRRTESLDALLAEGRDAGLLADRTAGPEARLLYYQLSEHVLAVLPARQRAALTLVEALDCSYEEAAATLGISLSALKSQLWRARQTLLRRFPDLLMEDTS